MDILLGDASMIFLRSMDAANGLFTGWNMFGFTEIPGIVPVNYLPVIRSVVKVTGELVALADLSPLMKVR
ncbi:MAG: hypothetical protein ABI091_22115 [Ferruginibacter sp.]